MKENIKAKIRENQEKIKYMETIFGNSYFELLGQTIEKGYSIQEAIDICYEWLTENE